MKHLILRRPRSSKYGAVPTVIEGIRFASKKEAARYQELRLLEKAGEIHGLTVQQMFPLVAVAELDGTRHIVGVYRADFCYYLKDSAAIVVEDTKGMDTPLSKWKRKHCELQYGIRIRIT